VAVVAHSYELTRGEIVTGLALGAWILLCDGGLRLVARLATCPDAQGSAFGPDTLGVLLNAPEGCAPTDMAGPSIQLLANTHDGALLGLAAGLVPGVMGQLYALALLALATIMTVLVARWQWRSGADPKALACVWAGALSAAGPRMMGDGRGVSEIALFGLSTGIGELALLWGVAWLLGRFIGELRA
jgi:hypothetical protein